MANITRIKNNQITDSTITYTKLASGTLVGSVFNSNLTLNSNVTIVGNLSITGNSAIVNATNTTVNDPLVVFNNGYVGTPSYDIGIIANRNLQSLGAYGSVNVAWIWEENAGQWQALATTETGTTTGQINNSGWANVRVGNLVSVTSNTTGAALVGGTLGVTGATTLTTATTGGLQAVAIGNVTPGTGVFTSLTAQTETVGGLQAVAIGNVTPGTGVFTTGTFNTATTGGLQAVAIGNVTPGTGAFTTLTSSSTIIASGNIVAASGTASTNTTTGALVVAGGAGVSGAVYAGSLYDNGNRVLTSFSSSGAGNVTVSISNPTSSTIALTATGPGVAQWGGTTQLPYLSTDAYGRVSAAGNIALNTVAVTNLGNTTEITANNAVGLTGLSLTTTGVSAGNYGSATVIPTVVVDSKGRVTSITTNAVSTSFTVAGTTGSTPVANGATLTFASTNGVTVAVDATYANISTPQDVRTTANPTFNNITGASFQGVIGNVTPAAGTFTTGTFNTATTGGLQAVAIGNVTPGTGAFTTLTASTWANVTGTTDSTSASTGALVTAGGVGIAKNLNVGGNVVITGNLTVNGDVTTVNAATLDVEDLNITVAKGAATASAANGAGLTVDGANATFTYASADDSWNVNKLFKGTGATFNTITTGGLQAVAIGNVTPGTGVFTTLSATTLTVPAINNTVIGNTSASTAFFTTANATNIYAATIGNVGTVLNGTLAATSISGTVATANVSLYEQITSSTTNATFYPAFFDKTSGNGANFVSSSLTYNPSTGALSATSFNGIGTFSTATTSGTFIASGNIVAAATTDSTSNVTGAVIVGGGLGVAGNIRAGNAISSVHSLRGNLLIGSAPASYVGSALSVNLNTAIAIPGGAQVHLTPGDDRGAVVLADSFGTTVSSVFVGRHARGTLASPSAVQANDQIAGFRGYGYGTTGFVSAVTYNTPGVTLYAAENFTDTAQGTYITLDVNRIGTNSAVTGVRIDSTGNVVIPATTTSTSTTTGALTVKGGVGIVGNIHSSGDFNTSGVINASGGTLTNGLTLNGNTDMTGAGTGALILNNGGGASISGNVYVGKNLYIGPSALTKNLTTPTIIAVDSGGAYAQMAMVNTADSGSSDFSAYTNNGDDYGGWVDVGIAGSNFSDGNYTITKPQDGYLITRPTSNAAGGNIILATSEAGFQNDIIIGIGSFHSNAEVARFHGNSSTSGTFVVELPTPNTATANTGAFQVWGGESISGNSYIGGGAIINGSQTANYDFKVRGVGSTNLLWARPNSSYDQVIIGNTISAASLTTGARLIINSTDSLLLPVGTSAQRPSGQGYTDVAGMFRYNSTIGGLEFYTGALWASISSNFTIITDQQFNGDGVNTVFTLSAPSTTAATIVSINGIVQVPTLAYSISSSSLTFTEAPASGDVIDVRVLVTTQTVTGIASENGYMGFNTTNTTANVLAGTSSAQTVTYWDTSGAQVSALPNVSVSTANVATTIDTFATASYRTAKYVVQATNGSNYQSMEALVVHDNTTASIVSYGIVQTGSNLGILNATVSSGNVLVQFVPAISSTNVRLSKNYLLI